MRVAIIDYGSGNLRSAAKAFERAAAETGAAAEITVTADPEAVARADRVVLPGVGAFADCLGGLEAIGGMRAALEDSVRDRGRPFLGICVGMQILFDESDEFGRVAGLGILPGRVTRFPADPEGHRKVPQMGWNTISIRRPAPHLEGVADEAFVYFVHSYYVEPADDAVVATTTEYGHAFASSVWRDNLFATQFHPEKSQAVGLRVLANFARLVNGRS